MSTIPRTFHAHAARHTRAIRFYGRGDVAYALFFNVLLAICQFYHIGILLLRPSPGDIDGEI